VRRARASERDCLTFFRRAIHLSSLARCSALRYSSSAFCHCALSVSRSSYIYIYNLIKELYDSFIIIIIMRLLWYYYSYYYILFIIVEKRKR